VFDQLQKGRRTVKKLLSVLVMAGLLAGLGCGGDTKTTEKEKKSSTSTTTPKEKSEKPDTRKDL
jgi:hypothetical protein